MPKIKTSVKVLQTYGYGFIATYIFYIQLLQCVLSPGLPTRKSVFYSEVMFMQ